MLNKLISILPVRTGDLFIRKEELDDADLLLKMDKQEDTQMYLGGIKDKTKEERITFLEKNIKKMEEGKSTFLVVCLNNIPIGFTGIKVNEDGLYELSYIFDSDYTRLGYCTKACAKLIDICFNTLNIDMIVADTIEDNVDSKRVLEKLGFVYQKSYIKDDKPFLLYRSINVNKKED